MDNRKRFLLKMGAGLFAAGLPGWASSQKNPGNNIDMNDFIQDTRPDDEKFWNHIAQKYYNVSSEYINLENGYYGIQPKPVLAAFQKHVTFTNSEGARFARKHFPGISTEIKKELATFLEVSEEEIIITRNATEALNIAIQGYPFKSGDEVIVNQLDYFSMIETFRMLEKRGMIKVKTFEMPLLRVNEDEITEKYREQITDKTKVILLTHVSNINGLIVPVSKISAIAKQKGIDTITDSAHALGQIRFSLPGLNSDFVGMNLHKWIGNPIGAGVLYVKKERVVELNPLFGDVNHTDDNIEKLSHFGTTPFAIMMTIPDSIAFHKLLGAERISGRLHYLKSLWVNELKENKKVEILSPPENNLSCAIASFRIKNQSTNEVTDYLFKQHGILTVGRSLGKEGCIRVTPSVYNSANDIKKFIKAINDFTSS